MACFAFLIPAPLRLCFDPLQCGCNSTKDVTVTSRCKTFDAEKKGRRIQNIYDRGWSWGRVSFSSRRKMRHKPVEVGHDDGDGEGDTEHPADGAERAHQLPPCCRWCYVTISCNVIFSLNLTFIMFSISHVLHAAPDSLLGHHHHDQHRLILCCLLQFPAVLKSYIASINGQVLYLVGC